MKNTVVIFNAGIGALTLGFQNAGYEILKAYEPDRKVIEIYQENISQNVTACSLSSIDPATVPDSDVWAFDLTQSKAEEVFRSLALVQRRRPPAILFVMKKQLWKGFIKEHIFQLQDMDTISRIKISRVRRLLHFRCGKNLHILFQKE